MEVYLLRALERLLVVLAGAGSIYLGYRLFLHIPFEKDAEGRVSIPNGPEIQLSRIGPGAFFALFGCLVLGTSLYSQVSYRESAPASPAGATQQSVHYREWSGAVPRRPPAADRPAELMRLRGYLGTVNALGGRVTAGLPAEEALLAEVELRELRLGLMRAHWAEDLGEWAAFRDWVSASAPGAEPPAPLARAVAIYRHGL